MSLATQGQGMKVPVRLIPKITVYTAAHDNKSSEPAPRVPSTSHGVAGSPNPR